MNEIIYQTINDPIYAKQIMEIWAKCFNQRYSDFDIISLEKQFSDQNNKIYGCSINDSLISFINYRIYDDYIYLKLFATLLQYRSLGISTNLLNFSLQELKKDSKDIKLNCNTKKLEQYYQKFGFKTYKEIEQYQFIYKKKSLIKEMILKKVTNEVNHK